MNRFFFSLAAKSPGQAQALSDLYGNDSVITRIVDEYGAVMMATNGAVPPDRIIFQNQAEVEAFQASVDKSEGTMGGHLIELQTTAMDALKNAIAEADLAGLTITPRGNDSAKRSYEQTVTLWLSRVVPGLEHWISKWQDLDRDS